MERVNTLSQGVSEGGTSRRKRSSGRESLRDARGCSKKASRRDEKSCSRNDVISYRSEIAHEGKLEGILEGKLI